MLLPLLLTLATAAGFEKNLGQTDPQVRYLLRSRDVSVFLTDRETVFRTSSGSSVFMESAGKPVADSVATSTITSFVGPRERWREEVPVFDRIRRRDVFPGVDLVHYGAEYDYVVAPGANPQAIAVRFRGQRSLWIDETGALVFDNDLRHKRPVAYQLGASGVKVPVDAWFQLRGSDVTFGLGAYDTSRELVIDPVFEALRFYGGSGDDRFMTLAIGVPAVAGYTNSPEFPPSSPEGRSGLDIAVYMPGENVALYFGGSGDERILAQETFQNTAILVGETASHDLPAGAILGFGEVKFDVVQEAFGGGEKDGFVLQCVFVPKFYSPAKILAAATYVGGSGNDRATSVATPLVFLETDSPDLAVRGENVRREPTASFVWEIYGTYASYLEGEPVQASIHVPSGEIVGGGPDGAISVFEPRASRLPPRRFLNPQAFPVRALSFSRNWGVIAAGDSSIARIRLQDFEPVRIFPLPANLQVKALTVYGNYAFAGGQTADRKLSVTGGAPQSLYGGGDSDGFVLALDLEDGSLPLVTYAGGPGRDEVTGLQAGFQGAPLRIFGVSSEAWGDARDSFGGGVDSFETSLPLPLLWLPVPGRAGKDLQFRLRLEAGDELVSSDPEALRIYNEDDGLRRIEVIAGSGTPIMTIRRNGYWPAKFALPIEPLTARFEYAGDRLTLRAGQPQSVVFAVWLPTSYVYDDQFLEFRSGVALPVVQFRLTNPALGVVTPYTILVERMLAQTVVVSPVMAGAGELVFETDSLLLQLGRRAIPVVVEEVGNNRVSSNR